MKQAAILFDALVANKDATAQEAILASALPTMLDADKLWVIALLAGKRPKRTITTAQLRQCACELSATPEWLFDQCLAAVGDTVETASHLVYGTGKEEGSLAQLIDRIDRWRDLNVDVKTEHIRTAWQDLDDPSRFWFNKLITGTFRVSVRRRTMASALAQATGLASGAIALRLSQAWDPQRMSYQRLVLNATISSDPSAYPFRQASHLTADPSSVLGAPEAWAVEHAVEGSRVQLIMRSQQLHVWNEDGELITNELPALHHLAEKLIDGVALDGVLQVPGGNSLASVKDKSNASFIFRAFDLLEFEGRDVRQLPLIERRGMLERLVALTNDPSLTVARQQTFSSMQELIAAHGTARAQRSVGLILKRTASAYVGPAEDWLLWKHDPFIAKAVLTYSAQQPDRGDRLFREHTFGAWHNGELITFAKTDKGLNEEALEEIDAFVRDNTVERFGPVRQVEPLLVFEIAFEGISASARHKSGVSLRKPRIHRFLREASVDKAITLEDLKRLIQP